MRRKNKGIVFIIVVFLVIGAILLINCLKNNNHLDEKTIRCVAANSTLFVSRTCGNCALQKQDLGDYIDYFNIIDCTTNPQECSQNNILYVPTWFIKGERLPSGIKTWTELKELTGC